MAQDIDFLDHSGRRQVIASQQQGLHAYFLHYLAITQLYNLSSEGQGHTHHKRLGQILGVIFVGFSLLFLYFGNARYFHAQHAMCKGYFPASRGSVFMASATVLGVLLVMLVIMVIDRAS